MADFVVRRLFRTVIVMWGASVVVFLALRITPGDPTNFVTNPLQTPERKAAIRHQLGLDQSIAEQYWHFLRRVVTLDFGDSFITQQSISQIVRQAAPHTLELAGLAGVIVLGLGIPLGVLAALHRNGPADHAIGGVAALGLGIPNFVLALVLIKLLSLELGWFPVAGSGSFRYLVLPAVVLSIEPLAVTIRMMRSAVLDQLGLDYVQTLRAKGLARSRIVWLHVLRNSIAPIVSLTAVQFRSLLGYTLIIEVIFRWPGLGQALVNAVLTRDFPVAQMLALLLTLAVIFLTFLADIGLALVDPRIRAQVFVVSAQLDATTATGETSSDSAPARMRLRLRTLRSSFAVVVGGTLVGIFLVGGLVGVALLYVPRFKHTWSDQDLLQTLKPPGTAHHLLGTDALGRDLLARLVAGLGVSFTLAFAVTALTLVIGMVLGLAAGYFGGVVDSVISGLIDIVWGFPLILLAVMLAGIMHPGFLSILFAVGLLNWAGFARVIRGYALSLREREFVEAARALGIPSWRILLSHFVPNVLAPTLVMGSYYVAVTIIVEAGVSFLGLGIQPPTPSLGQLIADGRNYLNASAWQVVVPGGAIALSVLGFNLLGDGLRDLLDPRLSKPQG